MPLINWNDSYSVNVKEIDKQHQKLVDLINDLHEGMRTGKGKEILGKILKGLEDYTVYHFGFEEKLLNQANYPDIRTHSKIHQDFVADLKDKIAKYESGQTVLTMEIMDFLKNWLMNHIMGTDKKYTSFVNGKGIL